MRENVASALIVAGAQALVEPGEVLGAVVVVLTRTGPQIFAIANCEEAATGLVPLFDAVRATTHQAKQEVLSAFAAAAGRGRN